LNEHTFSPDVLVAGTRFWETLSEEEQQWLQKAAQKSIEYQRELWAEAEAEALKKVQEAGVTISYPDKEPFAESCKEVYQLYEQDSILKRIIKEIKELEP
jgi:TRAP-type C4-dicarboxylate transport system substrate-binding protein